MAERTLLVVEDDASLRETMMYTLRREGYRVLVAADGVTALEVARQQPPALILLDLMLPRLDGLDVCRQLRSRPETAQTPILMLTARGEESDRIRGFETGADDYVTKPFSPRELLARVGAVLRRVRPSLAGEQLAYADLEMDVESHRVRRGGSTIQLGPTEFRLLRHFMESPARVFSRERLLDAVWAHDPDIDARTVDVHVRRLRQALNAGGKPDLIRTVRSAGYALDADG